MLTTFEHYEIVLADLERKRDLCERVIKAIKELMELGIIPQGEAEKEGRT